MAASSELFPQPTFPTMPTSIPRTVIGLRAVAWKIEETLDPVQGYFGFQETIDHPGEVVERKNEHAHKRQRCKHLGGSELVPHEDIGDEDGDADDHWQGSPEVHTGCIQVFDNTESSQLFSPASLHSVPQSLLPPEEFDDSNATQ